MAHQKQRTDRDEPENGEKGERAPEGSPGRMDVTAARKPYLIAARRSSALRAAGLQPITDVQLSGIVRQIPGVEIERVIHARRTTFDASPWWAEEAGDVYVARIESDRAEALRRTLPPQLFVEEDACLRMDRSGPSQPSPLPDSWKLAGALKPTRFAIQVLGAGDRPLRNAAVMLSGEGLPTQGMTDEKGQIVLEAIVLPGSHVRSLFVAAQSGHWDRWIDEPELSDTTLNVIRLQGLRETFQGLPEQYRFPWGARAMGLDRLDPQLGGAGVKIAILDSGADSAHPQLRHITNGFDLTNGEDTASWKQDLLGHGSGCAGTIAARSESPTSFRGLAPDAEILVLKIFPGGRLSTLIDALDLCIQRRVDLVNLSLCSEQPSLAVAQKLEECVANGVACIVSAGSSAGSVEFPATSPHVLAVGALGKLGEFPTGSWDAATVGEIDPRNGFFSPSFACAGPEVALCAPGVGILSTAPGGDYDAQSGTSLAAAHVTGLAALLLAHHPVFVQHLPARGAQRVSALFQMLRSICAPLPFSAGRSGAGLPRIDLLAHQLIVKPSPADVAGAPGTRGDPRASSQSPQQMFVTGAQGGASPIFAARSDLAALACLGGSYTPDVVSGAGALGYVLPGQYLTWLLPHFQS